MKNLVYIITTIFFLPLILCFSSCEKEEPGNGYALDKKNNRFFRCTLNGEEWTKESFGSRDGIELNYYERSKTFSLTVERRPNHNNYEYIYIYIYENFKIGENILENKADFLFADAISNTYYFTDTTYNNNILYVESIDYDNQVFIGTLNFRAITEDGKDTVLVEGGEFKIRTNTWKSQKYDNFLSCKVNGEVWKPYLFSNDEFFIGEINTEYSQASQLLNFSAYNNYKLHQQSRLYIDLLINSVDDCSYQGVDTIYNHFFSNNSSLEECQAHFLDPSYNNQCYIEELDHENQRIKGTFEFRAINQECHDTVLVTDGKFDLNPYYI